MKAVFFRRHGGNEVLEYGDWPDPHPGAGEVVVGIRAAAANISSAGAPFGAVRVSCWVVTCCATSSAVPGSLSIWKTRIGNGWPSA